jgi:hypothetical protein
MDGLPGMKRGVETGKTDSVKPIKKMVGQYAPVNGPRRAKKVYSSDHLVLVAFLSSILTAVLIFLVLNYGPGSSNSRSLWTGR